MAFTSYKRKDRKNKTVSHQRIQANKLNTKLVNVKSPNVERVVVVEE
ncbi:MAG: hypothetical protein WCO28_05135 [Bacteroidota bacterium]